MRKFLIFLPVLCFLLSGCWDYKDLNKLSIVSGIAFDRGEGGGIKVTLEIVDRSSSTKKEGLRTRTVAGSAGDVNSAVEKLARGLDFELYYGAVAVAVFGKDVPREELEAWLFRNRELRETVYIIYADKAGEMLQSKEDGGIAAFKLRDILNASKEEKPLELYKLGRNRLPAGRGLRHGVKSKTET
jgi:spore germination protein KC